MQIYVSLLPAMRSVDDQVDVAVVIDVLRATSVMTKAIAEGAKSVITCQEIDEARALAGDMPQRPMLCGERQCKPIEGFDCGNSPAEYDTATVTGRTLVLTTSNGTRAIAAATQASQILIGSFLNLSALVQRVKSFEHLHLVCAGTNGEVTAEDTLLAGAIIDQLMHGQLMHGQLMHGQSGPDNLAIEDSNIKYSNTVELCGDDAILAHQLWEQWCPGDGLPTVDTLVDCLAKSRGGRNLINVGYELDLTLCAQLDSIPVVPQRVAINPPTFAK